MIESVRLSRCSTVAVIVPNLGSNWGDHDQPSGKWIHSFLAILGAPIDASLTILMFREHEALPSPAGPASPVPTSDRRMVLLFDPGNAAISAIS